MISMLFSQHEKWHEGPREAAGKYPLVETKKAREDGNANIESKHTKVLLLKGRE
jgi:hypothetical protein